MRERFDGLAGSLDFERRPLRWSFESADAMLKFYGETAGPGLALMQSLDDEGKAQIREEFVELVGEFNRRPAARSRSTASTCWSSRAGAARRGRGRGRRRP